MLKTYTLADVRGFYAANYGAQRASIYVVGRFDEKAAKKAIQASFAGWSKGPAVQMPVQTATEGAHFAFIDQPGAAQSNVIFGLPVADVKSPDTTPLDVMNSLLGGSFGCASRPTFVSRRATPIRRTALSRKAMEPTSGRRTPLSPPQPQVRRFRKL